MANILPVEKQVAAIAALVEGTSIRCTPAMAVGVSSRIWSVRDLVEMAQ